MVLRRRGALTRPTIHKLGGGHGVGVVHGETHVRTPDKLGDSARCRSTETAGLRCQLGGWEKTESRDKAAGRVNRDRRRLHDNGCQGELLRIKGEHGARLASHGRGEGKVTQRLHVQQIGIEPKHGRFPSRDLRAAWHHANTTRRRGSRRRPKVQEDPGPALPNSVGDVQIPAHGMEESRFVLVDLLGVKARNLTPSTSRVVSVLEIFGGQDQGSEEHATTTLQGSRRLIVLGLFHGEILSRNVFFDQD